MTIRIAAGSSYRWRWEPAIPDGYASGGGTLSLFFAAGTTTHVLAARADDSILTISDDRRRLTLTWGADGTLDEDGDGQPMAVWFDGGASQQGPGRVARLVSDSGGLTGIVELCDPLPMAVAVGASVIWQTHFVSLSSVPSLIQGPVRWKVGYSAVVNGVDGGSRIDEGVLFIVRAPFATGLTHEELVRRSPWLTQSVPDGQQGWAPQIDAALPRLITRIQRRLPSGVTIERVAGPVFRGAHGAETRKLILVALQESGQDRATAIEQAERDVTDALDDIFAGGLDWYDADGDGLATDGEGALRPSVAMPLAHTQYAAQFDATASDAVARAPFERIRVEDWRSR